MKLNYRLFSYTKINSKWIKYSNIRPETINYIEENMGTKFMDLCFRKDFMILSPKASEVIAKINKWDYIKLKRFLHSKRNQQQNQKANNQMGSLIY